MGTLPLASALSRRTELIRQEVTGDMTGSTAAQVAQGDDILLQRLQAVEDHLAILNLLAGSALSSDAPSENYWQSLYADAATMDRGAGQAALSRDDMMAVVRGPEQERASAHGMAHLGALPHVVIAGEQAVATGYLLIVVPDGAAPPVALPGKGTAGQLALYQLTVNRWDFIRTSTGWQVSQRKIRPLTSDEARAMLHGGLAMTINV